jgi:adenylate kinase
VALVRERLQEADVQKGYILDGFPRTIPQAEALAAFASIDKVVNFDIPDEDVVKRLGGRRVCPECGANYHTLSRKPAKEGQCDKCHSVLAVRGDDTEEAIKKRLEVYRTQTAPLIGYYSKIGVLVDIDARPAIDDVVDNFKKVMME